MKRLAIVLICGLSLNLNQAVCSNLSDNIKIIAGYNRSNLVLNDDLPEEQFGEVEHYYIGNFNIGLVTELYPTYYLGASYFRRGTRETQEVEMLIQYGNGDEEYVAIDGENIHTMNYLSVYGYKTFTLFRNLFAVIGANCDVYLSGKIKAKADIYSGYYWHDLDIILDDYNEVSETLEFHEMYSKEPDALGVGGKIGFGLELTQKIQVMATYQMGFTQAHEISYDDTDYTNSWKHKTLLLQVVVGL